MLEAFNWGILRRVAYSPDHLFASMGHALAEQHFGSYEDVKKRLDEWFAGKGEDFYLRGIHNLPEKWGKCLTRIGP